MTDHEFYDEYDTKMKRTLQQNLSVVGRWALVMIIGFCFGGLIGVGISAVGLLIINLIP